MTIVDSQVDAALRVLKQRLEEEKDREMKLCLLSAMMCELVDGMLPSTLEVVVNAAREAGQ